MSGSKPTVYLDTNIFSVLAYRGGQVESLAQHMKTREWWELERPHFRLYTSRWTEHELERGTFKAQSQALAAARRVAYLSKSAEVDEWTARYLESGLVPESKYGDAIQLAFATSYRLDYLLTWNHAHLARADIQHSLELLHRKMGWRTPWLVSPDTIPWASLGQPIRRKEK